MLKQAESTSTSSIITFKWSTLIFRVCPSGSNRSYHKHGDFKILLLRVTYLMLKAGRRVKCREMHQQFPSRHLSSHADSFQKNLILHPVCFFVVCLFLPSCDPVAKVISAVPLPLCPSYHVCQSQNIFAMISYATLKL